jgi:hypothetical protein
VPVVVGLTLLVGCQSSSHATSGSQPDATSSPTPTVNLGSCADVQIAANYPGGRADFRVGEPAKIALGVGQSFVLTASGTCGVEYRPDNSHLVFTPGQSAPPFFLGGAPGQADSSPLATVGGGPVATLLPQSVSFTANAVGTSDLPVVVDDHVSADDFDTAIEIVIMVEHK